ncbi:hypothetical protein KC19_VG127700 [Ceratodon purpureus]|uniref:Uncharacterized protein n=1 Tax=Ceratodon purpureus TaxID=3225 RepID=A0A8T0HQ03_CERPU|nr:hypothetical protein KC19_VG127700 [Ceratodon purpureus]
MKTPCFDVFFEFLRVISSTCFLSIHLEISSALRGSKQRESSSTCCFVFAIDLFLSTKPNPDIRKPLLLTRAIIPAPSQHITLLRRSRKLNRTIKSSATLSPVTAHPTSEHLSHPHAQHTPHRLCHPHNIRHTNQRKPKQETLRTHAQPVIHHLPVNTQLTGATNL